MKKIAPETTLEIISFLCESGLVKKKTIETIIDNDGARIICEMKNVNAKINGEKWEKAFYNSIPEEDRHIINIMYADGDYINILFNGKRYEVRQESGYPYLCKHYATDSIEEAEKVRDQFNAENPGFTFTIKDMNKIYTEEW